MAFLNRVQIGSLFTFEIRLSLLFLEMGSRDNDSSGGPNRLKDVIKFTKFAAPTWTHDDLGVSYLRFPAPSHANTENFVNDLSASGANSRAELYYYRLGTSQEEDVLVIAQDKKIATSIWYPTVSA